MGTGPSKQARGAGVQAPEVRNQHINSAGPTNTLNV